MNKQKNTTSHKKKTKTKAKERRQPAPFRKKIQTSIRPSCQQQEKKSQIVKKFFKFFRPLSLTLMTDGQT